MGQLIGDINDRPGATYQLSVANRLWGQTGKSFLPAFLSTMNTDYRAPLSRLDFIDAPESSRQTINTWTADQTNQKIQDLMPQGSITPNTQLVLTNAIYFDGKWDDPFNTSLTNPESFTLASGSVESVSMMHQESSFKYGSFQNFSMLEMPYQGGDLSMLAILPNTANGLPAVEKSLNAQTLKQDESRLKLTEVKLGLPKFTINSGFGLGATLAKMGMPTAFTKAADFSGMDGQNDLHIDSVIHKAFINVNEDGTEAAAATGVTMTTTAIEEYPPSPAIFDADHPFDYMIVDNKTGSLLFMGRVTDPGGSLLLSPLADDPFFSSSNSLGSFDLLPPSLSITPLGPTLPASFASAFAPAAEFSPVSAVPEPSTLVLMLGGIIGLVLFARRRNGGQKNGEQKYEERER
jgi:serpin B